MVGGYAANGGLRTFRSQNAHRIGSAMVAEPTVRCSGVKPNLASESGPSWLNLDLMLIGALAVPLLPVLHLSNRLSTRRTVTTVVWLARFKVSSDRCDPAVVSRAVNAVARVLRLQSTTCLARSQLLWLILSVTGRRPVIRVGAGSGLGSTTFLGSTTLAHAWVELDGEPVGDSVEVAVLHPPFDRPLLGSIDPAPGQGRSQ